MPRFFARPGDQRVPLCFTEQQVNIPGHDETQAPQKSGLGWSSALALH
jgi:hypothetical protein